MSTTITPILAVQLAALVASPAIPTNAISGFTVAANPTTSGNDVKFSLTTTTGISAVTLGRGYVNDSAQAVILQTWNPSVSAFTWSDTDSALQSEQQAFYWIVLSPTGTSGTPVTVGPQAIELNPQLGLPVPSAVISASSSAAANGFVTITVNVSGIAPSQKIYASGYKGNAAFVAVAQSVGSPIQFTMQATGETVTLKAIGVSAGGTEAASGPTTTITLNGVLTVPAQPQGVAVVQIATGNQISFPASKDASSTYMLYRAQRGQAFVSASLLATVTGTAGTIIYLDTGGLSGDWEYFILATNAAGNSSPSLPASPAVLFTSAGVPPNAPANTTNNATIDSIDSGTSALARIYGPGGVGTSYLRYTGFGSLTRPNGTIAGLAYATVYAVLWTGSTYAAVTSYTATLPDGYELVGTFQTTQATGVVGTGATVAIVISGGIVIQANPVNTGSGYVTATVNISGGGGSGAQIQANVSGGKVTSYTVINGGSGYTTAPTGTVVGGSSAGVTGGGGSTGTIAGSRGCVEVGTEVEVPEGTVEELLTCSDWVLVDVGDGPVYMHPETLVSVFKQANELTPEDRIEVKGGIWRTGAIGTATHEGIKVKRACPGGVYFAGPNKIRLHNQKIVMT